METNNGANYTKGHLDQLFSLLAETRAIGKTFFVVLGVKVIPDVTTYLVDEVTSIKNRDLRVGQTSKASEEKGGPGERAAFAIRNGWELNELCIATSKAIKNLFEDKETTVHKLLSRLDAIDSEAYQQQTTQLIPLVAVKTAPAAKKTEITEERALQIIHNFRGRTLRILDVFIENERWMLPEEIAQRLETGDLGRDAVASSLINMGSLYVGNEKIMDRKTEKGRSLYFPCESTGFWHFYKNKRSIASKNVRDFLKTQLTVAK